MMNAKKKLAAALAAGVMALSALSVGFAAWQTTITADGNVTASGKWDISLTDASLEVSSVGAEIKPDYSNYKLQLKKLTGSQLGNLCVDVAVPRTLCNTSAQRGTQSTTVGLDRNNNCWMWLVDTTRFDITRLGTISDSEERRLTMLAGEKDGSIIRIGRENVDPDGKTVPAMKAWNYYKNKNDYFGDSTVEPIIAADLVEKCNDYIRRMRPDTFQNYALISYGLDGSANCSHIQYVVAEMGSTDGSLPADVTYTKDQAVFAGVHFSLPGAWANYTLTITNNGTADAYLRDAVISLEGDCDQLVLDKPDFTDEVLKAGESCTFNVVVKVADIEENELSANAVLTITLPYGQITVEEAPQPGHSHN